ncbi:ABC transporter ATP-binding protein [Actinospica durhamensis]|uniref:ABC transporter ATP-binding protein n=1 Tax=Actinospica durhamensis TaxID=1508375 RepID=A0A941EQH3_9ACTN|nr:ABC transporter ATP-binding protein [Actinospica durhamensis]MBR7836087.1 ABC transporter ATP-binding protein [Actinospica durhamensis]
MRSIPALRGHSDLLAASGPSRLSALAGLQLVQAMFPVALVSAFSGVFEAVDRKAGPGRSGAVLSALLVLGVLLALQRLMELVVDPVQSRIARGIDVRLRDRVVRALYRPTTIEHSETSAMRGNLAVLGDDRRGHTPGNAIAAAVGLAAKILACCWCLAIVAERSPWAALIAALTLIVRRRLQQRSFGYIYASWSLIGAPARWYEYWRQFHIDPAAAKEIRVFGLADWSLGRFLSSAAARFEPVSRGRRRASRTSRLPFAVSAAGMFGALALVVGDHDLAGAGPVPALAAILTAWRLSEPAGENLAIEHARPVYRAATEVLAVSAKRAAAELEDAAPVVGIDAPAGPPPHIRFEQVDFHYPGTEITVLRGVDLDIRPGATIGVVGPNGAGKSTVTKLLARLYEPGAGRITVDGADLRGVDAAGWRGRIAVMPQNFVHYDLPLRSNVVLGAPERRHETAFVDAVLPRLGLEDLLAKLPDGWDTRLGAGGDGGVQLSGGEWQRVGLARAAFAVHAGRDIVVLDEPTAHLDAEAEALVLGQLGALAESATVIIVSHRLATIRRADRIVLLRAGRVAESGTHDELIALDGDYARMYAAQAEHYRADEDLDDADDPEDAGLEDVLEARR